jgi:protein TonB
MVRNFILPLNAYDMEAKKTPRADLGKFHGLFFSVGLLVSLSLANIAFDWKESDRSTLNLISKSVNNFETLLEIPPTEITPPPPLILTQPKIIEVPNEEKIEREINVDFNIEVNEKTKMQEVEYQPVISKVEPEDTEVIFVVVEKVAEPKDGMAKFYTYIADNLFYPAQARRMGVEGKVFVEFVVNKDGSLTDIVVVRGIGAGCDEEAIRIIKNCPAWNAARQRGKPVRQRMVLPISFKLAI